MSDENDILRTGDGGAFRLRADVTLLMLKGAGYAMAFCLVVWFAIWAVAAIGRTLPEDSRDTEDPTPFSQLEWHVDHLQA